jgi:hypothetical protein
MLYGDTFSMPKDSPLPVFTPYPQGARVVIGAQNSLDKIKEMEQGVIALKQEADPYYASYLNQVLAQIRVAKGAGREFSDSNFSLLQRQYWPMLEQIAAETAAKKQRAGAQYPKIPSLPRPDFPMPSDPSIVFDQPTVDLPTVTGKAPGSAGTQPSAPPPPPAKPSFFTSSGIMDLVNVLAQGWSNKEKIDAQAKLLAAQMAGKPLTVNPLLQQAVNQKEATRFPWQWVIIGGVALGALVVLATLPPRQQPDLTKVS